MGVNLPPILKES